MDNLSLDMIEFVDWNMVMDSPEYPVGAASPYLTWTAGSDLTTPYQLHSCAGTTYSSGSSSPVASVVSTTNTTSGDATTTSPPRPSKSAVAAACLSCRAKHLKCDGQSPCGRCHVTSSDCKYVASRRGYKGPRRVLAGPASPIPSLPDSPPLRILPSSKPPAAMTTPVVTPLIAAADGNAIKSPILAYQDPSLEHTKADDLFWASFGEACVDSFYRQFYPTHSFVPPKQWLVRIANQDSAAPLLAAIRWIGSLHMASSHISGELFFQEAYGLAYDGTRPQDGWLVQALLLLALGLELMCRREKARAALAYAETLFGRLANVPQPLSTLDGSAHAALKDSWRRTREAIASVRRVLRVQPKVQHVNVGMGIAFQHGLLGWDQMGASVEQQEDIWLK